MIPAVVTDAGSGPICGEEEMAEWSSMEMSDKS